MGTYGLEIYRFHGRYYIYYHQMDGYFEGVGAKIVASIPADPVEYQEWLQRQRARFAEKERILERGVYEIRDGVKPDYSLFEKYGRLPSSFLRQKYPGPYTYIINLDREILTMNFDIHWKLGNIPRQDYQWLRAISDSIYRYRLTISLDECPEEHMASPAIELSPPDWEIRYESCTVTPKTNIEEARKAFLTYILADVIVQYQDEILPFGAEWSPDSLPFRELTFALVSIASGQAGFHSFPANSCNPRECSFYFCDADHPRELPGWLDERWVGDKAPILDFGSYSHRPGEPPGASPLETIYWLEGVLVSLVLVVDGAAITKAVSWGVEQGCTHFQIVVLSLFKVAFVEVSCENGMKPFVKASHAIDLSPLRARYCMSIHPRERPALKPGMEERVLQGEAIILHSDCKGSIRRMRKYFPGLAALVNFFEIAASRRAASKSAGVFPLELYELILDFVDYDTWKSCLLVSTMIRAYCLRKYRLDDRMRIVAGPFTKRRGEECHQPVMSYDFENMQTGKIVSMTQHGRGRRPMDCNWMPIIGSDRKALMMEVSVQYMPAENMPVESDSDDELEEIDS